MFRGWNRLCLQAASLNAAEGASAAATAAARAARANAMEMEATAAKQKAAAIAATEEAMTENAGANPAGASALALRAEAAEQALKKRGRCCAWRLVRKERGPKNIRSVRLFFNAVNKIITTASALQRGRRNR